MKLGLLLPLLALAALSAYAQKSQSDGIALAIVYDTSGSMSDPVRSKAGGFSPKYVIANRALEAIVERLGLYQSNSSAAAPRRIEAGLYTFDALSAREAVPWGPLDPTALRQWLRDFSKPLGPTPLGESLRLATGKVLSSELPRKHVLVITDGENTVGPAPSAVLPDLVARSKKLGQQVSFHFVAFDVSAKLFDPLKQLGATVLNARDEQQLNEQLEQILGGRILLEDEEPPRVLGKRP